jgi:hypothetical protein
VKSNEANILSFKILVTAKGELVTELSGIPEDQLHKVFKDEDLVLLRKIIREARPKLEELHSDLESELSAFFGFSVFLLLKEQ